jgi:FKBP-type peptidyl-prolyl cis-trans isomerase FkpA
MKHFFALGILGLFVLSSLGCKKKESQAEKDEAIIVEYIEANGISATATGSGLYYVIEQQGTGPSCNAFSDVKVSYTGYLTNGVVFDQSTAGITINLQQVIKGWTEGIPYFKEGGSGKLFIPSELGYGSQQVGNIPANSVLIFDVELIEVL